MTAIPKPADNTVKRIYASWEARSKLRFSRRLGASQIGRPCDREIWYGFRWAKQQAFEGRMLRLFARGGIEETCIGEDLKNIGVEFMPLDPDTGEQWEFSELGDHFVAKLDGAGCGFVEAPATWHVVEIKTANDKSFSVLQKEGVQKAKPEHYAQMQVGMSMSGMDRAVYLAVNKNDENIHMERIRFNKADYSRILQRAKEIIFSNTAPDRINDSPAWWQCKFCGFANICHDNGELAAVNCRTCKFSMAQESGGWMCDKNGTALPSQPCTDHVYAEGMCGASVHKAQQAFNAKLTGQLHV